MGGRIACRRDDVPDGRRPLPPQQREGQRDADGEGGKSRRHRTVGTEQDDRQQRTGHRRPEPGRVAAKRRVERERPRCRPAGRAPRAQRDLELRPVLLVLGPCEDEQDGDSERHPEPRRCARRAASPASGRRSRAGRGRSRSPPTPASAAAIERPAPPPRPPHAAGKPRDRNDGAGDQREEEAGDRAGEGAVNPASSRRPRGRRRCTAADAAETDRQPEREGHPPGEHRRHRGEPEPDDPEPGPGPKARAAIEPKTGRRRDRAQGADQPPARAAPQRRVDQAVAGDRVPEYQSGFQSTKPCSPQRSARNVCAARSGVCGGRGRRSAPGRPRSPGLPCGPGQAARA